MREWIVDSFLGRPRAYRADSKASVFPVHDQSELHILIDGVDETASTFLPLEILFEMLRRMGYSVTEGPKP